MKANTVFITSIIILFLLFVLSGCNKSNNSTESNTESNTSNSVVSIGGHVYICNSANIPIQGAVVGTSLDTIITITDSLGSFMLITHTAAHYASTPYTIYITASGYQPGGGTWSWGDHPINQVFCLSH